MADATLLPVTLLPELLALEARPPAELQSLVQAALEQPDESAPGVLALQQVFRHAARLGWEPAALEAEARRLGLGAGAAATLAHCWAMHADRSGLLQQTVDVQSLVDLDWTFGGAARPPSTSPSVVHLPSPPVPDARRRAHPSQ